VLPEHCAAAWRGALSASSSASVRASGREEAREPPLRGAREPSLRGAHEPPRGAEACRSDACAQIDGGAAMVDDDGEEAISLRTYAAQAGELSPKRTHFLQQKKRLRLTREIRLV